VREIGVRALRERLSDVLTEVEAGETVVVTNKGRAIAKIAPVYVDTPKEVRRLLESGRASWGGQRLGPLEPVEIAPGQAVADILLSQRGPDDLSG
jgi:prevent-host-death family protein